MCHIVSQASDVACTNKTRPEHTASSRGQQKQFRFFKLLFDSIFAGESHLDIRGGGYEYEVRAQQQLHLRKMKASEAGLKQDCTKTA